MLLVYNAILAHNIAQRLIRAQAFERGGWHERGGDPTAVIIIGNEILSGRTVDANLAFLAKELGGIGIPVREARVVPDVEAES